MAEEEFEDLPESALDNLDEYDRFEDFVANDMPLEVCRNIKFKTCKMLVQQKTRESQELDAMEDRHETKQDRQVKEIAHLEMIVLRDYLRPDKEIVYDGILKKLKPGQKWNKLDTQGYMNNVFITWPDDIERL